MHDALARSWAYSQRSGIEQPGAFVRRCMVNAYISAGRHRSSVERLWREEGAAAISPDLSEDVVSRQDVWAALSSLPRHQRALPVLRFYEDLTESQIATVLGIGVGAVLSGSHGRVPHHVSRDEACQLVRVLLPIDPWIRSRELPTR